MSCTRAWVYTFCRLRLLLHQRVLHFGRLIGTSYEMSDGWTMTPLQGSQAATDRGQREERDIPLLSTAKGLQGLSSRNHRPRCPTQPRIKAGSLRRGLRRAVSSGSCLTDGGCGKLGLPRQMMTRRIASLKLVHMTQRTHPRHYRRRSERRMTMRQMRRICQWPSPPDEC